MKRSKCVGDDMPMVILYVTQNYESVQKHLYESLKGLAENVYLAHYKLVNSRSEEQFPDGVTYIDSKIKVKGFLFYCLKLWRVYTKCVKAFDSTALDVIHGNMLFCDGYICRRLAKKKNIPYCVSVRDTDINSRFLWKIPWTRRMGLRNIADASGIFFLSGKYQDKLIAKVPQYYKEIILNKSFVVPNGIDDYFIKNSMYKEESDAETIRLIFVGKISKRKNLETVIAACRRLIERGRSVELDVVGPIVDHEYETLIADAHFVKYHGLCNKEQVTEKLRGSDIFVMPSHTETFGLVYLEAMTQGLPVIYTRGQGFDGQFPDGSVGIAVSDNNPDELVQAIETIKQNYSKMSNNATRLSMRYTWEEIAIKYYNAYKTIKENYKPGL